MSENNGKTQRYVYRTAGVCPKEIQLYSDGRRLYDIRFMGGGCPGNAELVTRLLKGKTLDELAPLLEGIACRNDTSCPGQLAAALRDLKTGSLEAAPSFRLCQATRPFERVALLGDLRPSRNPAGDLDPLLAAAREAGAQAVLLLGNLFGQITGIPAVLSILSQEDLLPNLGADDWELLKTGVLTERPGYASKALLSLPLMPHATSFTMCGQTALAFFGSYLQELPGYSDFEPFSLEINMVCDLAAFLEDESVFPALEAMTAQFTARVILFSQPGQWMHKTVGGIDFFGVGRARDEGSLRWGLLECRDGRPTLRTMTVKAR